MEMKTASWITHAATLSTHACAPMHAHPCMRTHASAPMHAGGRRHTTPFNSSGEKEYNKGQLLGSAIWPLTPGLLKKG